MKKLAIIAIVLSTIALAGQIFIFATQKENADDLYQKAMKSDYKIYAPVLPDTLVFAGEKVPLETFYVREGLDRELLSNMYFHSSTLLNMKRAGRYFPIIEPILRENGVPQDFKYLCVIESGLQNVTSPAKAQGYWQFIKTTGTTYGLTVTDEIDMRNDLEASTRAACKYLKSLRSSLGSWTAAAAAYNCGEVGLRSRMSKQSVSSYYDTRLNSETARYVYRILAIKLIFQHPQDYGFYIRRCDLYSPLPYDTVTLSGQNVDLYAFAQQNGTTYKMLRDLNPWLQTDKLVNKANKSYTVKIPKKGGTLQRNIQKDHNTALVTRL
ncbi:MAG: lytic transglycosylase domain-containing protein [Bacteroidales bacterium]|nr:lytic transglycosylase domain-containing protein [Bacteroidales bacterium]